MDKDNVLDLIYDVTSSSSSNIDEVNQTMKDKEEVNGVKNKYSSQQILEVYVGITLNKCPF